MPDSTLTTRRQTIEVDQVQAVDVTEIVDDKSGGKVREVRVYGTPNGTDAPPVVTLRLTADTADPLQLTTPKLDY